MTRHLDMSVIILLGVISFATSDIVNETSFSTRVTHVIIRVNLS